MDPATIKDETGPADATHSHAWGQGRESVGADQVPRIHPAIGYSGETDSQEAGERRTERVGIAQQWTPLSRPQFVPGGRPLMSDRKWVWGPRIIPSWPDVKRILEGLAALAALVLLAPLFLVLIVAIKLDSPGPVFFRVRRVGYLGRELSMLKFRKMHDGARGAPLTTQGDPRLTRVGRILACCRLDELPQLWHVLRGEMSIVGPRPEDPLFVSLHPEPYRTILSVRPGITGLSQIAYKEEASIVDDERLIEDYLGRIMPQKLVLDTLYATGSTLRLDLSIARWTLITMLLRTPVSVNRRTARMSVRRRRTAEVVRLPILQSAPRGKLAVAAAGPGSAGPAVASQTMRGCVTGDSGRVATGPLLAQPCPDGAS